MSVESMAWVLNHCTAKGTDKVVMIGIANHADNRGRNAWPSIATLAAYANVTERAVQQSIQRLVESGDLRVQDQRGGDEDTRSDRRPNRYVILGMQPVDIVPDGVKQPSPRPVHGVKPSTPRGEAQRVHGVKPTSPEPSLEPSLNRPSSSARDEQPTPAPIEAGPDDDDEADLVALVAAKVVARANADGQQPKRGYGLRCAANLQAGGPDHEQIDELRALRAQHPTLDRAAAAEIVVTGHRPGIPAVSTGSVISLEVRQAVSMVAGLIQTGALDEARDWIEQDCPDGARAAALAELERRTGRTAS